jgi:hypothetical protein
MNKNRLIIGIIICFLSVIALMIIIIPHPVEAKLTPTNYLGLAKLHIIPTTIQCTHSPETYFSTNVTMMDKKGNRYLILQSKFLDESCLIKI